MKANLKRQLEIASSENKALRDEGYKERDKSRDLERKLASEIEKVADSRKSVNHAKGRALFFAVAVVRKGDQWPKDPECPQCTPAVGGRPNGGLCTLHQAEAYLMDPVRPEWP